MKRIVLLVLTFVFAIVMSGDYEWSADQLIGGRTLEEWDAKGIADSTTVAEVSIQFYYTVEAGTHYHDLEKKIDFFLNRTNTAFMNSQMKLRVYSRCAPIPTYVHDKDAWTLNEGFRQLMGVDTNTKLRNSADISVLMAINAISAGGGGDGFPLPSIFIATGVRKRMHSQLS